MSTLERYRYLAATRPAPASQHDIADTYGRLPLAFERNVGQTDARVQFLSRGDGYTMFFAGNQTVLALGGRAQSPHAAIRMTLTGSAPDASATSLEPLSGVTNYFIGKDPRKWHANVPSYGRIQYNDIYPGIDVVYYGNQRQLEYDFVVAPGADPGVIALNIEGAHALEVDANGNLVVDLSDGHVALKKPFAYQKVDEAGAVREVPVAYVIRNSHEVRLAAAAYDHDKTLIIDPVLIYGSYLGGTGLDVGVDLALDAAGNAYVSGITGSVDFPTTVGAFQSANGGGIGGLLGVPTDAFVAKMNATGTGLIYSTYLGGTDDDVAFGIAVDAAGAAYVDGMTQSTNFPTTAGAFQSTFGGGRLDVFVTKLNASGGLAYSTYIGGGCGDQAAGIAVDASGSAYIVGSSTRSGNSQATFNCTQTYPITPGALQPTFHQGVDVIVTKLNPAGSALVYSTYLRGTVGPPALDDFGNAIAIDASGNAYIAGSTTTSNFPTTPGAFQTTAATRGTCPEQFCYYAFVSKINSTGTALVYSTYLGGNTAEEANGIAIDASGNAYVAGYTASTNFPTTAGAYQTTKRGGTDAFVVKVNATGTALLSSTLLGGSTGVPGTNASQVASGIAIDASGNVYVDGNTRASNFPTTANALQTTHGGGSIYPNLFCEHGYCDGFVARLNPSLSALSYSSYLGGTGNDSPGGLAVDAAGNIYVAGTTTSTDFRTTTGAFQTGMSSGGVSGLWFGSALSNLPCAPCQIDLSLQRDGNNVFGAAAGGEIRLHGSLTAQSGSTYTYNVVAHIDDAPLSCANPGLSGTMTVDTLNSTLNGFLSGINSDCLFETDTLALNKVSELSSGFVVKLHPTAATAVNTLSVNPTTLRFAATKAGATGAILQVTPSQIAGVSVAGVAPAWTATADQPWVQLTNGSGSASGQLTVGIVNPSNVLGASTNKTANVTVTAGTLTATVAVTLTVDLGSSGTGAKAPPIGSFDTPTDGGTSLSGAIPLTGWTLDDLGVAKVQLWRNCVEAIDRPANACTAAAPGTAPNFVFIADAVFLSGARPDVEGLNPTTPAAYRAGWGYLMATNALPHVPAGGASGGQGTFTLTAYAIDVEGQFALLGTKTISLDNDHATIPFGALDTPSQGGTITQSPFASFGWAMTQSTSPTGPKCIDTSATVSYKVYIDGVSLPLTASGNWFAGLTRPDIAAAYPGRCNTNSALAAYYIDVAALGLADGLHTTGWDVIDDKGNIAGIGSRFFNVLIGSSSTAALSSNSAAVLVSSTGRSGLMDAALALSDRPAVLGQASALDALAPAPQRLVRARIGSDEAPSAPVAPDSRGQYAVQFGAGGRVALDLGGSVEAGYQLVGDELRALPAGSSLNAAAGQFAWQPPVPFLGPFHLVFVSGPGSPGSDARLDVLTTITDPTATAGIAMHIDAPAADATVSGSFVVAGWAVDPLAMTGSGIDTLHVWAYRRDRIALPQFLGAAAVGGARPDVAGIYGAQFEASGFTLTTPALAPGVYDLLVYPWSHRTGQFGQAASSARITVR